jgi:hypothetical protein
MIKWIDASEDVPHEKQTVLIYSPSDGMGLATYDGYNFYWIHKEICGSKFVNGATHWAGVEPPMHRCDIDAFRSTLPSQEAREG